MWLAATPDVVPLEQIVGLPCVVLLGEPGMGKTSTLENARPAIDHRVEQEGGETLWLRLRSYATDVRLESELFRSAEFRRWECGDQPLHIFLDDLDECPLSLPLVASLLVDSLRKYPEEATRRRLHLYLACRTAAWPSALEAVLRELWGVHAVAVYELAHLRRLDVECAARANDLDPDAFLSQVERADAVPLAARPVTLEFLIRTYRTSGSFPLRQSELYLEGCRELCTEPNRLRNLGPDRGAPEADQRLAVAGRIAAAMIFAGRGAISTDERAGGDAPDSAALLSDSSAGPRRLGRVSSSSTKPRSTQPSRPGYSRRAAPT